MYQKFERKARAEMSQAGQNLVRADDNLGNCYLRGTQNVDDINRVNMMIQDLEKVSKTSLIVKETNPVHAALIRPLKLAQEALAELVEKGKKIRSDLEQARSDFKSAEQEYQHAQDYHQERLDDLEKWQKQQTV